MMEVKIGPKVKKLRSPSQISSPSRTSITCSNVPECLFDATAAKKHFSKFGRINRIVLRPKRQMCIIEYDAVAAADRALLNAGAYDGFMFEVTRSKTKRRPSKKDDDPDWVPDSDVEEELQLMSRAPVYRVLRQKAAEDRKVAAVEERKAVAVEERKAVAVEERKAVAVEERKVAGKALSTAEAAQELHGLRGRSARSEEERWRMLEARDRVLRLWGGTGRRGREGATAGTCRDLCPEKERLQRAAERSLAPLELQHGATLKQYARSSADQEAPLAHELRPAPALRRAQAFLLLRVADAKPAPDWFHFMWDRLRAIRKDVAQQALCCADAVRLLERCARFHAHAAVLLQRAGVDAKLNTDNLAKCLQTLKHLYADAPPHHRPLEPEFRCYVALLNLGDSNFWWEIKQLPRHIQKSEPITFAMDIFNALDNNNYVRFFRLVRERATYLQACILLRYFNDVRARALARIVKAYAPRGGSRYSAQNLMNDLAFENVEDMKSFITHYGLRFSKTEDSDLAIILDRNQFIEDSDPYPTLRAKTLIESKRQRSVGETVAGEPLLSDEEYNFHVVHSSFNDNGTLKESALTAEDQGYSPDNDSDKSIASLKDELARLAQNNIAKYYSNDSNVFTTPLKSNLGANVNNSVECYTKYLFKPAIPINDIKSSESTSDADKTLFLFSKPQESDHLNSKMELSAKSGKKSFLFGKPIELADPTFRKQTNNENSSLFSNSLQNTKSSMPPNNKKLFSSNNIETAINVNSKSIFGQNHTKKDSTNLFRDQKISESIFTSSSVNSENVSNIFVKPDLIKNNNNNIFMKIDSTSNTKKPSDNIFNKHSVQLQDSPSNLEIGQDGAKNIFAQVMKSDITSNSTSLFNQKNTKAESIFKTATGLPNGSDTGGYNIFKSKNEADQSLAATIFNTANAETKDSVYDFDDEDSQLKNEFEKAEAEKKRIEENQLQEMLKEEQRRLKAEQEKKLEERKRLEEIKLAEQKKQEEKRKQEELKRKLENERREAELKRIEEEKRFNLRIEEESNLVSEEIIDKISSETVVDLLKEEMKNLKELLLYADEVEKEVISELCDNICMDEMKAEMHRIKKLWSKYFCQWKRQLWRNRNRRVLLEGTPRWIARKSPHQTAAALKRSAEAAALTSMNAFNKGKRFKGELKPLPQLKPFNIIKIIKSCLVKRMKEIHYPYDKCYFWKVTIVSAGSEWINKKVELSNWIVEKFSDKRKHEVSETLLHVQKQTWNQIMDFAIAVSLIDEKSKNHFEALEGSNGLLFYASENEANFENRIKSICEEKYSCQILPVAVVLPQDCIHKHIMEQCLTRLKATNCISAYRLFFIDTENTYESMDRVTQAALKWLAKECPPNPQLEIDYLKSICQTYLGNEIWYRLKVLRQAQTCDAFRNLHKIAQFYNAAVDKLTDIISDGSCQNVSLFPLEFKCYLDNKSPYPKPYEFIPSNVKNSENTSIIRNIMNELKLPITFPGAHCHTTAITLVDQIYSYCKEIGWFEKPEEIACKVISLRIDAGDKLDIDAQHFDQYDLLDFLNIIIYEKICRLNNFENKFVVYRKTRLQEYRQINWWYESDLIVDSMKHKSNHEYDYLDSMIEAKRKCNLAERRQHLVLEERDSCLVEETIKAVESKIAKYSRYHNTAQQLQHQLDIEKRKAAELENILRKALLDA